MAGIDFIVVTGMSGAGKSAASRCLEDLGFFCIDNLPATLIPKVAELCAQSEKRIERVALVVDAREGRFLDGLFDILADLRRDGHPVRVVFLETSDEVLVRRFSESRRPHPLAPGGSALEGIRAERALLAHLKAKADLVIDTSSFTVHEFRKLLAGSFLDLPAPSRTALSLLSFGYKHGLPVDADLVFDARCLPNPHFVEALQPLTGRAPQVVEYVLGFAQARGFVERIQEFLKFTLPLYVQESKAYLTIAVGCTGGRHRSVVLAEELARLLREAGYEVSVRHRDVERTD
ncbi:MAG: RNase adapter RapZ [candidate division NC10 bacterium]|nr:RNase adapter RapZ [candidate division NC10 bacterium]MBI2164061.1 RNase adapter RapZ [candidate division NC10 bacterium]MBI2458878.1 RNase adapter RapZ [candidate division NC10 bacterium]MBI2564100.1 RNase adapter RapZ [candidate division NC10 bacterium]MBI3121703.1 RNase adapter RapZ [candidate division NC10 bacterium]